MPNVRVLSLLATVGCALVISATYAISSCLGTIPGWAPDDYRLSAAWDMPPATEVAVVGLSLTLDLLPLIELVRPNAGARMARVLLAACAVHGIVTVAATPMSKLRPLHALSTFGFLAALTAYETTLFFTVPQTLRAPYGDVVRALAAGVVVSVFGVLSGLSTWVHQGRLGPLTHAEGVAMLLIGASIAVAGIGAKVE